MELRAHPSVRHFAVCLLGLGLAGAVDYLAGFEIRTYPLYFGPVAYGAWYLSRRWVTLLALASTASWVVSNYAAGGHYSSPYVWAWNSAAQLLSFALVGHLIVELRRRLTEEESRSRLDPLTGLANRRAFYESAETLIRLAQRSRTPLTLAYVDLDNFKQVNDQHGHQGGDEALVAAAAVLKEQLRASDVVARLGGDEFAVLLWNAPAEQARALLERVRSAAESEMQAKGWPVTISAGALAYPHPPASVEAAVQEADALMYRAKQGGKNRVHLEVYAAAPPAR